MKCLFLFFFLSINAWADAPGAGRLRVVGGAEVSRNLLGFKNSRDALARKNDPYLAKTQLNPEIHNPVENRIFNLSDQRMQIESGTGTRGGGSGILSIDSDGTVKVILLDVFRSSRLDLFPLFFETDPELLALAASLDAKSAASQIYELVMNRTKKILPNLAKRIQEIEKNLPVRSWVPAKSELPVLDDFIGDLILKDHQKQVQIAYRRNNQIIFNEDLLAVMDGLSRAALQYHEYIYALSGIEFSVQTQRLVSLLISSKMKNENFAMEAKRILSDIDLEVLDQENLELPAGVSIDPSRKKPGIFNVCGLLHFMQTKLQPDGSFILDTMNDPKVPRLTRKDVDVSVLGQRGFFSKDTKYARVFLKPMARRQFLHSLGSATAYLQMKFPLYLYPTRIIDHPIVCFNKVTQQISSMDFSVRYHKKNNALQMESSALEAEYFKVQRKAILEPSSESLLNFEKMKYELSKKNLGSKELRTIAINNLFEQFESEELGWIKLEFDITP